MSKSSTRQIQHVIAAGDVIIDWNFANVHVGPGARDHAGAHTDTYVFRQSGGAALMAELLTAVGERLGDDRRIIRTVHSFEAPQKPLAPGDPRFHHAYYQWRQFPHSNKSADESPLVWRLSERLGLSRKCAVNDPSEVLDPIDGGADVALVVLDDAGLGFRDESESWPACLQAGARPWILLKMSSPVAQGALWEHLRSHHGNNLIVIATIDDLRRTEVQISRELSWERTAQDLFWELVYNPHINSLSHCAHVIVGFGAAGCVLFSRQQITSARETEPDLVQCRLFFDPTVIEGLWEQDYPGEMIGGTYCLAASVARQIMIAPDRPDFEQAVQDGLTTLRHLFRTGYGSDLAANLVDAPVTFPIESVVSKLEQGSSAFTGIQVRDPGQNLTGPDSPTHDSSQADLWTILEDRYVGGLDQVAQYIVRLGVDVALQGVPIGKFGSLVTVDRREIESFRSLRALIGEYGRQPNPKRPLSIAVFGAPGSGKSFGVTEVARSVMPGKSEKLDFNLSQFESPRQLLDAFHRVRDTVLSGRTPIVFWDEFDTVLDNEPLGWLRHFLAPMQDGIFQQGQIVHPIGRAIFVFAGGTCETMADFNRGVGDSMFRSAKGPDFVSRLKGYVNILGPNPRGSNSARDSYYIIRRAILLRYLLQTTAPQIFHRHADVRAPEIDSGVLRALLEIPFYKHGARSMEAIVTTSTLTGKRQFERSSLPTEAQLELHVDGRRFLSLVQRLELTDELIEKLAAVTYQSYRCEKGEDDHSRSPEFDELSADEKELNRKVMRDMPANLAYVGYILRTARSGERSFRLPAADRMKLAEMWHVRWLQAMLAAGWRYGTTVDHKRKLHPMLRRWATPASTEQWQLSNSEHSSAVGEHQLSEAEKQGLLALIDHIPQIAAGAGYTLNKVREDAQHTRAVEYFDQGGGATL